MGDPRRPGDLGIGTGWYDDEHRAYGIPFPPLGERLEILEEQLEILTGLWRTPVGETFDFDGVHHSIAGSPALPTRTTVVVQANLSGPDGFGRAPKVLAGFTKAVVAAGAAEQVVVRIPAEPFRRWDGTGWVVDPGTWTVSVAASATDVRQRLELEVR